MHTAFAEVRENGAVDETAAGGREAEDGRAEEEDEETAGDSAFN